MSEQAMTDADAGVDGGGGATVEDPPAVPTWITEVAAVVDLTPRLRQITLTGGLEHFVPAAPDQFVYVLAPPPGCDRLTIDRTFSWQAYEELPDDERPVGAYYTIRRWDPGRASLDLWVVLHGHGGPGERWARTADIGSPVALWGPRAAYAPPSGLRSLHLFGDETALPAVAAILESLDEATETWVTVSVHDPDHAISLDSRARLHVEWVTPSPGEANPLLAAARRRRGDLARASYVWGGAESREITAVRRYVRDAVGLAREQVSLVGYWRRDQDEELSE